MVSRRKAGSSELFRKSIARQNQEISELHPESTEPGNSSAYKRKIRSNLPQATHGIQEHRFIYFEESHREIGTYLTD